MNLVDPFHLLSKLDINLDPLDLSKKKKKIKIMVLDEVKQVESMSPI